MEDGALYQCDSESFSKAPEHQQRCDVVNGLPLHPTESLAVFRVSFSLFISLSHVNVSRRPASIVLVCKKTPVHHLPIEFDRLSYATLSVFQVLGLFST